MAEKYKGCGCEDTFVEILSENQTGRGSFRTKVTHCPNCRSKISELI